MPAIQPADLEPSRPSPEALLAAAAENRGRLKVFLGAAPRRRQDLRDADRRARAPQGRRRRRHRHRRDPQARRDRSAARRLRDRAAAQGRVSRQRAGRDGHRRHPGAQAQAGAGGRAGPHQRARQPAREALPGRRGTAGRRHRRLFDAQHPAPREPERRGRADHHGAGARDLARPCDRQGGRGRADRPHAQGPDPAPERGQGLCAGSRAARAEPLFLRRQPDRPARAVAAPHRAAGRRPDADLHAGPRHPGPVGGGRAHPGLHQRASERGRPHPLCAARGGPAAGALGRALYRDAALSPAVGRRRRTASRRPCAWRSGWARPR